MLVCISVCLSVSVCLFVFCLSVCLFVGPSVCLTVGLFVCLPVCDLDRLFDFDIQSQVQ